MLRPPEFAALLSIQLTAAGGVFSLALSGAGRAAVLLILPLITYMLAGRHVAHSYASASVGTYIRVELTAGMLWLSWVLGVALTSASTRILWKIRTDSFLLTGPASDSG